jgi:DNA-binding response OmpR family regulator
MGCYRDLFGGWRWELRDADGHMRDSQNAYDSRHDCIDEARKARLTLGLASGPASKPRGRQDQDHRDSDIQRTLLCVQPHIEAQEAISQAVPDYTIVSACNGYEAIRNLNGRVFDAYIIDCWLPDWSGIELCREIRKTDPQAPICFYSTAQSPQCRNRAARAGANVFLRNPDDIESLSGRLRSFLNRSDLQSLHAKLAEQEAIQNELERRAEVVVARLERARMMSSDAVERMAKVRADRAFMEAGGTRANFERWWHEVFAGSVARP